VDRGPRTRIDRETDRHLAKRIGRSVCSHQRTQPNRPKSFARRSSSLCLSVYSQIQRCSSRHRPWLSGSGTGGEGLAGGEVRRPPNPARLVDLPLTTGLLIKVKIQNWMGIENEECNGVLTFILQLWSKEESNSRGSPRSRRSWPAVTRGEKKKNLIYYTRDFPN
jgi:hypothetical protein